MVSPSLKRYLLAVDRYKWPALASFLGVLGVSSLVALWPSPPQYRASGSLVQNFPLVTVTTVGSEIQKRGQGIVAKEFLLADVLLQRVAEALQTRGIELAPEQIRDRISVQLNGEEGQLQRVTISFTWPDAETAQTVLELLFDGIIELSQVANQARQQAIVTALEERLPTIATELRLAEQALEAYDRLEGPALQAALDGSLLGAISSSQQQRRQNQILLAGIESQIQSLQGQLGMTADEALTASALSADPIIAELRGQILTTEAQLELLASDLRPAHPTMQELRNNQTAYNTLLKERAAEVIGGGDLADLPSVSQVRQNSALDPARAALANQLVVLSAERDAIQQQQQVLSQSEVDLRQQYSSLPNKQLERNRLAQQVALKQALYDQIQAKRIDAEAAAAETLSSLMVAEPPTTLLWHQGRLHPVAILMAGGLLGLGLAGAMVFLLDSADVTARTPDELQEIFDEQEVPLLAQIPTLTVVSNPQNSILLGPSPYAVVYERLRTNLRLATRQDAAQTGARIILIASPDSQEGKTVTAFNLGIAAARAGQRALVVEADFHHPSQGRLLGISLPAQAVMEPLRYYAGDHSDPCQRVPAVEHLYCAPVPGPQSYTAALLESAEFDQFLATAKARFDWIILDTPALNYSTDARVLADKADGVVMVARPDYTVAAALDEALDQWLDSSDHKFLGGVINDSGPSSQANFPSQRAEIDIPPALPQTRSKPETPVNSTEF